MKKSLAENLWLEITYLHEVKQFALFLAWVSLVHISTRCTSLKCGFQTTDGAPQQFVLCVLTLRHLVVSSTNVRRARVINWKIVCVVLCCDQCVQIYTEQISFVGGINFLFSFEENCYWIVPITSRSLWWTCSIAKYVWMMVSAFQKRYLRHKTRRKTRNMENIQKNSRM